MRPEVGLPEVGPDGGAGIVLHGFEAVEPGLPLLRELVILEGGRPQAIGGDLHDLGKVLGQAVGAYDGVFLGRREAQIGAQEVHGFGDRVGVHRGRALHHQGGGQAGHAFEIGGLIGRAGAPDPHLEADEGQVGALQKIDGEAVLEGQLLGRGQLERGPGEDRRGGEEGQGEEDPRSGSSLRTSFGDEPSDRLVVLGEVFPGRGLDLGQLDGRVGVHDR